jgi:hypothetical protein
MRWPFPICGIPVLSALFAFIHEVIERPTGAVARCSLVDAAIARVQEIPVWMLDTAACWAGTNETPFWYA